MWFSEFGAADSAGRRLFAFPYGGAGAGAFRALAAAMPRDWVLSAMVAPGRERRFREPPFSDVHSLLDALMPAFEALLDRPFAFLGHSVGALVAFELCRRLRREGLPMPELLCVSARVAPAAPRRMHDFHTLSGDALVEAVLALNRSSLGPAPIPDFIRAVEPQLRADFAITDTYRYSPEPSLKVPLLAVGSSDDPSVRPEDLDAWKAETEVAFETQVFPDGGHFFLDRHANALAARIERAWQRAV
ncbi:alpha/beta fold hydrolase [Paucibacter sp. APW11]|uniref:Alpha/beta fold hydrolase n=1 Tax=Roseateles aquae TaxID=3077235 RepID=A0ABU3PAT4_9BURK|nr:alpha/beta fold hydrolase [Paucibacter sp. APW11]